ncbi:di/tricarboxylate transporter [Nocardia sp. GAS34]|uniref:SLC13 family permease n=1 Tax=unclassified Nocardia TaxID=2637762 RepID=UPI003D245DFA
MSLLQVFSLVLLIAAFAFAIWRHINVGLVTISAGFILTTVAGVPVGTYFKYFPGSLVILIVGVTYLFGHVLRNGAIDRLIGITERATGRRDWLLPWIMFAVAALLSGIGALPTASLAIVIPIAIRTALLRDINLMLMGVVTVMGGLAGGFSPISVWGQLVGTLVTHAGRSESSIGLFVIEFGLNLLVAVAAFIIYGGVGLMRRKTTTELGPSEGPSASSEQGGRFTRSQIGSLVGLVVFAGAVLVLPVDVGLTAFVVGLILQLVFRPAEREIIRDLPWSVVLIVSGVLLYVGLLDKLGTFDAIAHHLQGINSLSLTILALAFVGSLFASFESSSVAVLGIVIPVALQVTHGATDAGLLLILCAVCWAIVTISTSPYHLCGGLVLVSSPEGVQPRLFRQLLMWSFGVAVVIPLIGWTIPFVVSG